MSGRRKRRRRDDHEIVKKATTIAKWRKVLQFVTLNGSTLTFNDYLRGQLRMCRGRQRQFFAIFSIIGSLDLES